MSSRISSCPGVLSAFIFLELNEEGRRRNGRPAIFFSQVWKRAKPLAATATHFFSCPAATVLPFISLPSFLPFPPFLFHLSSSFCSSSLNPLAPLFPLAVQLPNFFFFFPLYLHCPYTLPLHSLSSSPLCLSSLVFISPPFHFPGIHSVTFLTSPSPFLVSHPFFSPLSPNSFSPSLIFFAFPFLYHLSFELTYIHFLSYTHIFPLASVYLYSFLSPPSHSECNLLYFFFFLF